MKITYEFDRNHPELQDCPAGCIISKAVIVINPDLFYQYDEFQRKFILLHEEGHIALRTGIEVEDEISADAYAFDRLAGTEFKSLKQCLNFLKILLVPGIPSTDSRIAALYDRAVQWDARH
jgi:hypothetical protein